MNELEFVPCGNHNLIAIYKAKYVFSQIIALLNRSISSITLFKSIETIYIKHFTCKNQHLAMIFEQLCNRSNLKNLIILVGENIYALDPTTIGFCLTVF